MQVSGHTDNIPIAFSERFDLNWDLSAARAAAVADFFFANNGIDSQRVSVFGYADTKPVSDNDSVAGRAQNRWIEILRRVVSYPAVYRHIRMRPTDRGHKWLFLQRSSAPLSRIRTVRPDRPFVIISSLVVGVIAINLVAIIFESIPAYAEAYGPTFFD